MDAADEVERPLSTNDQTATTEQALQQRALIDWTNLDQADRIARGLMD